MQERNHESVVLQCCVARAFSVQPVRPLFCVDVSSKGTDSYSQRPGLAPQLHKAQGPSQEPEDSPQAVSTKNNLPFWPFRAPCSEASIPATPYLNGQESINLGSD